MEDYQLRKDIDRFKAFLDDLEALMVKELGTTEGTLSQVFDRYYDLSEVESAKGELVNDLNDLSTDLDKFEGDLDTFDGQLTGFDTQLTEFSGTLEGFDTQLTTFNGTLEGFDTQLTTFGGTLEDFDSQLDGFDDTLDGFNTQLGSFDTNLTALQNSLIAFNGSLITFNGDTEALATDLSELSDNFDAFLSDVTSLSSSLELFDAQLNGGTVGNTSYAGFMSYLNTLEHYMYGKGDTYVDANNQTQNYNYANPSSTSLKGMLNDLGNNLSNLQAGDTQLALTLQTLSSHLTAFSGTLGEFQDEIEDAVGSTTYNSLNQYLVSLVYEIASTNQQISDHQDLIEDVQDVIGEDTDTGQDTIFGMMYNTNQAVSDVESSAEDLTNTLYGGTNGTGTASTPANGTVMKNLNTVKDTTVPTLQNTLYGNGSPSNPQSTSVMGKVNTMKDTTIPTIQNQIHGGDVNNPTDASLMGRIGIVEEGVGDLEETTIPAVQSQVNTINTETIPAVQGEVNTLKNTTVPAVQSQVNTIKNTTIPNVQSQVNTIKNTTIPAVQGQIGTLQSDIGDKTNPSQGTLRYDINQVNSSADNLITTLYKGNSNGTTGNPANGTVMGNLNDAQTYIDLLDGGLSKLLDPSFALTWVLYYEGNPSQQTLNQIAEKFNSTINPNYWFNTSTTTLYKRTNNTWEEEDRSNLANQTILKIGLYVDLNNPFGFDLGGVNVAWYDTLMNYFYDIVTKKYYSIESGTEGVLGDYGHFKELSETPQFFQNTLLFEAIELYFSRLGHTHTKSNISDFAHTHTKSQITDFSHTHDDRYYTESEIDTKLNGKSNTGHTHDDRYYTESEVNTLLGTISSALNNYVPAGWTNLYNSTYGEVKHNGSMVSCYITSGSKPISATDWTDMARMGTNGLGISSSYFPEHTIFYQYTDGIILKLDTDGVLWANRPSGQKSASVAIYTMYAL